MDNLTNTIAEISNNIAITNPLGCNTKIMHKVIKVTLATITTRSDIKFLFVRPLGLQYIEE